MVNEMEKAMDTQPHPQPSLLRMARKAWMRDDIPRETARYYVLAWARSVHFLGDRWLLANKVNRSVR